jgi:hypothetical protein
MDAVNVAETPGIVVESASPPSATPPRPPSTVGPIEIGLGSFLLSGPGTSGIVGGSVFLFYEVAGNFYLRPSIAAGAAPGSIDRMTWAAGRLDACTRVPGNYKVDQGLQLDLCGGTDVGATYFASGTQAGEPAQGRTFPYVDLGPSLALRGELADKSAVWLRGSAGINVVRAAFDDSVGIYQTAPIASLRLELGFSWGR